MKKRNVLFGIGAGIIAALALSPKKGSEAYEEVKRKLNDIYLQAKELNMDDIKNEIENIRIEVSKLDASKSKEIVSEQSAKIKANLSDIIDKLQNNENIKPTLNNAVSNLENGIIDAINYIDKSDFQTKAQEAKETISAKVETLAADIKEKSNELKEKTQEQVDKISEKAMNKKDEILGNADQTVEYLEREVKNRKAELEKENIVRDSNLDDIKTVKEKADDDIDVKVREKVKQINKGLNK